MKVSAISNEYTASLTGNPFLFKETRIVAKMMTEGISEEAIRDFVICQNAFQCDRKNTNMKHLAEIKLRLSLLSGSLIKLINEADIETARLIVFYAVLMRYRMLREFMLEVIYEKLINLENIITIADINLWFNHKKEQEPQIAAWSDTTTQKLKQVLIKIVMEAGFLQKKKNEICILNVIIPQFLVDEIKNHGDIQYLKYFLIK